MMKIGQVMAHSVISTLLSFDSGYKITEKRILTDPVSDRAREIFEYIAPKYHVTLEEWNHDRDHVHIMFRAHPKSELSKFINAYKSASSRLIKKEYPEDSAEALERNVLEPEFLPVKCWWCTH